MQRALFILTLLGAVVSGAVLLHEIQRLHRSMGENESVYEHLSQMQAVTAELSGMNEYALLNTTSEELQRAAKRCEDTAIQMTNSPPKEAIPRLTTLTKLLLQAADLASAQQKQRAALDDNYQIFIKNSRAFLDNQHEKLTLLISEREPLPRIVKRLQMIRVSEDLLNVLSVMRIETLKSLERHQETSLNQTETLSTTARVLFDDLHELLGDEAESRQLTICQTALKDYRTEIDSFMSQRSQLLATLKQALILREALLHLFRDATHELSARLAQEQSTMQSKIERIQYGALIVAAFFVLLSLVGMAMEPGNTDETTPTATPLDQRLAQIEQRLAAMEVVAETGTDYD